MSVCALQRLPKYTNTWTHNANKPLTKAQTNRWLVSPYPSLPISLFLPLPSLRVTSQRSPLSPLWLPVLNHIPPSFCFFSSYHPSFSASLIILCFPSPPSLFPTFLFFHLSLKSIVLLGCYISVSLEKKKWFTRPSYYPPLILLLLLPPTCSNNFFLLSLSSHQTSFFLSLSLSSTPCFPFSHNLPIHLFLGVHPPSLSPLTSRTPYLSPLLRPSPSIHPVVVFQTVVTAGDRQGQDTCSHCHPSPADHRLTCCVGFCVCICVCVTAVSLKREGHEDLKCRGEWCEKTHTVIPRAARLTTVSCVNLMRACHYFCGRCLFLFFTDVAGKTKSYGGRRRETN